MKVYILYSKHSRAFPTSPKVYSVYLDGKMAREEAKRLNESPYTRGQFWVESKTVKE